MENLFYGVLLALSFSILLAAIVVSFQRVNEVNEQSRICLENQGFPVIVDGEFIVCIDNNTIVPMN